MFIEAKWISKHQNSKEDEVLNNEDYKRKLYFFSYFCW